MIIITAMYHADHADHGSLFHIVQEHRLSLIMIDVQNRILGKTRKVLKSMDEQKKKLKSK